MKSLRDTLRSYRNEMVVVVCHTVHVEESDVDVKVDPYRTLSIHYHLAFVCRDIPLYIT